MVDLQDWIAADAKKKEIQALQAEVANLPVCVACWIEAPSAKARAQGVEPWLFRKNVLLCTYCGKNGHSEDRCYSKRRDNHNKDSGRYFPHGKGGCAICGGMDHWKNECPDRGSYKDQKSNGNYKNNNIGGKRNSSSSISVDIGSNTLRALECLRCKGARKLTHCPECKV